MNIENLLRAAFDFSPGISSSSIADQTSSSGQGRQDKYQEFLDAVIDARTRLAEIRKNNALCYEILRLKFGLDKENERIAKLLEVPLSDVEELISQSIQYVCEEITTVPHIKREFSKPDRSPLEPGLAILILEGSLAGTKGDFITYDGVYSDRLVVRYFVSGQEQISIQNISDVDWN